MSGFTYDAKLKTALAKNFLSQFGPFAEDKFLLAVSKISGSTSENRSEEEELVTRSSTTIAKRIAPNDASLLTKRYNWSEGITMARFDSSVDMSTVTDPFYVLTNDDNVYICLENNNNVNGSDFEPVGTSTDEFVLPDGFRWKYLYTIPPDLQKFKSETEMPVPVLPFYSRIANAYEDQRQGQYAVQYEGRLSSTNGEIKAISRTTGNLVYNNAIPASPTNRVTSAGNDILTADAVAGSGTEGPSSTVGYYLRILSGVAAGEVRKIIDIPTAGSVKLDAPWTTGKVPKPNDLYEVGVGIQVNGDGVNAAAFGRIANQDKTLDTIVVYNQGSGYTTATASVIAPQYIGTQTQDTPTEYSLDVLVKKEIGGNAAFELLANKVGIIASLDGINDLPELNGNDFRDVILWRNAETNDGKLVGFDDDSLTTVLFKEPSESGTLKGFGLGVSDATFLVVGEQSNTAVETEGALQIDLSARSGSFIAKNLKKPFIEDESLLVLSKGSGQTVYTQNEKALQNFVTRFEDTTNNIKKDVFNCTTKLTLEFGSQQFSRDPAIDSTAIGASGSMGDIVSFRLNQNNLMVGDLFLTNVKNISGATDGFVIGERLDYQLAAGGTISGTLSAVIAPEIDLYSGEMVYIKGLDSAITRVTEQREDFKFVFEF